MCALLYSRMLVFCSALSMCGEVLERPLTGAFMSDSTLFLLLCVLPLVMLAVLMPPPICLFTQLNTFALKSESVMCVL